MTNKNTTAPGLPREEKIQLAGLITLIGFMAAALWCYIQGHYCSQPYPYNTFLFKPSDRFMDFLNPLYAVVDPAKLGGQMELLGYCPFYYLLCKGFGILSPQGALWTFFAGFLIFFLATTWRKLRCSNAFLTAIFCLILLLSYPFLYAVDRMNSELLLYIFLFLFASLYRRQRFNWAVLALSLAIACKPFPGVFGVLLLTDKRFKDAIKVAVITIGLSLLSVWLLRGGMAGDPRKMWEAWKTYQVLYAQGNAGFFFSHSLWSLLKYSFYGTPPYYGEAGDLVATVLPFYYEVLALIILAVTALHLFRYETVYWKKIALMVCCMNLLPFVSTDYKLIHLFIPFFWFINSPRARHDAFYAALFGFLFIPKPYWHLPSLNEADLRIPLNALGMTALMIAIFCEGRRTAGIRVEG